MRTPSELRLSVSMQPHSISVGFDELLSRDVLLAVAVLMLSLHSLVIVCRD